MLLTNMSSSREHCKLTKTDFSLLSGEITMCILAVGLSIGMLALPVPKKENMSRDAIDPVVGLMYLPSAISAGQFSNQNNWEPLLESQLNAIRAGEVDKTLVIRSTNTILISQNADRVQGQ